MSRTFVGSCLDPLHYLFKIEEFVKKIKVRYSFLPRLRHKQALTKDCLLKYLLPSEFYPQTLATNLAVNWCISIEKMHFG